MSLIQSLIEFRDKQASLEGLETYKVLQYKTIEEIARVAPSNPEELGQIKGIGPAKLKKYGKRILQIVESFSRRGGMNKVPKVYKEETERDPSTSSHQAWTSLRMADGGELSPKQSQDSRFQIQDSNKQVIRVGEYLEYLNLILAKTADVKIVGEVSGLKTYPSGLYFSLKDKEDESVLGCFLPVYTFRGLGVPLEDGMEVAVEGVPRLVRRNGRFQFTVENLELVGEGALKKAYELLKAKLSEEGLFERKRELPEFIESVGVITSRAGAVIHDFRNNLPRLGLKVYLKDVRVEGSSSSRMIMEAVKWFNDNLTLNPSPQKERGKPRADVLVIMRGGGSLEDMQAFNNEAVVRAVFSSKIPTIVAIGHDQDVPLAQLVADVMVSTPTAAAKRVESSWASLVTNLPLLSQGVLFNFEEQIGEFRSVLSLATTKASGFYSRLENLLQSFTEATLGQVSKLKQSIFHTQDFLLNRSKFIHLRFLDTLGGTLATLDKWSGIVQSSDPKRLLGLGYSIARNSSGKVIKSVKDVSMGEKIDVEVADGKVEAEVSRVVK